MVSLSLYILSASRFQRAITGLWAMRSRTVAMGLGGVHPHGPLVLERPRGPGAAAAPAQPLPVGTWGVGLAPRAAAVGAPAVAALAALAALTPRGNIVLRIGLHRLAGSCCGTLLEDEAGVALRLPLDLLARSVLLRSDLLRSVGRRHLSC